MTQDYADFIVEQCSKSRNTCPKCKSDEHAIVRNFDRMWGDGEVWCNKCEVKIRDFDIG